jgi:uncharacterized protein (DUF1015 family)
MEIEASAKSHLQQLIEDRVLVYEDQASFYIYRLSAGNHTQTGVVACCSLDEYEAGTIKKHEKTRPDKVADRTQHMLAVRAQTGLIFLTYRGTSKIRRLMNETADGKPIFDFNGTTGVRQTVWRVTRTSELAGAFLDVPALYIADGHHRVESAAIARRRLRDENPGHTGDEDYNFVLAGIFPAEELQILAYNRIVTDLNGMPDTELLNRIRENFRDTGESRSIPRGHGEICMYLSGRWYTFEFARESAGQNDPIEHLDVSILQHYILEPILRIADARTDDRIGFVGGARGVEELERLVDSGEARVAFSLYPTTMDDLFAVSDAGEIMPPKSTWFEPKLKDGLFVHLI